MADLPQKVYLIFDTNLIQIAGSKPKDRSSKVLEVIKEYLKKDYKPAISNITTYEALQRCTEAKEKRVLDKLKLFTQLEVSNKVLTVAAWLADLYRNDKVPDSQISDCDKIIAATAFLTKSVIITTDAHDYPRPFFKEKDKRIIQYLSEDGKDGFIIMYIFEPDFKVTNLKFKSIRK